MEMGMGKERERRGIPPFPHSLLDQSPRTGDVKLLQKTQTKATPRSLIVIGPQPSVSTSDTQAHIWRGTASWHIRQFIFGSLWLLFRYPQVDLTPESADCDMLGFPVRECVRCVCVLGRWVKHFSWVSAGCIKGLYQVRLLWQVYTGVCVCARFVCPCSVCVVVRDTDGHTFMSGPGGALLGRNVKAERRGEVAMTKSSPRLTLPLSHPNWYANSTFTFEMLQKQSWKVSFTSKCLHHKSKPPRTVERQTYLELIC